MTSWQNYLTIERKDKLGRIGALTIGTVRLHETHDGVTRDTTGEHLDKLKADVAEIEQILTSEGIPFDV